jgi:outer membrane protein assembly factor BamA
MLIFTPARANGTSLGTLSSQGSLATPSQAQAQEYRAKLLTVSEVGSGRYSPEQVASVSGLLIGSMVDRNAIQEGANRIAQSGLFTSVQYRFSSDLGGVHVTFDVKDAPAFPVSFDNFPWLSDAQLAQAIAQAGIPFTGSLPAEGTILAEIGGAVAKALEAKGIDVTVTHELGVRPETGEKLIIFRASGAGMTISSVEFSNPIAANSDSLRAQLPALIGRPYSRDFVEEFNAQQVEPMYLSSGYLHVQFGEPEAQLDKSTQGGVAVTVPIDTGSQYTWGGVTWSGNSVFTSADLATLVTTEGLRESSPADGLKIRALWAALQLAYAHRGYLDAKIQPAEAFNEASHSAAYRVTIDEGPQFHMGKLVLTGLSPEAEERVRTAWRIPQGQPFDETYYESFLSNGIAEALKGLPAAHDKVGRYLQKNPQNATVDVLIDFQ